VEERWNGHIYSRRRKVTIEEGNQGWMNMLPIFLSLYFAHIVRTYYSDGKAARLTPSSFPYSASEVGLVFFGSRPDGGV